MLELTKDMERYFKTKVKMCERILSIDGVSFHVEYRNDNEMYLIDWRNNWYRVIPSESSFFIHPCGVAIFDYKTVAVHSKYNTVYVLCEDTQEVEAIVNYAKLPMNETTDIDIVTYFDVYDDTDFMFYKNALQRMKEHLPL